MNRMGALIAAALLSLPTAMLRAQEVPEVRPLPPRSGGAMMFEHRISPPGLEAPPMIGAELVPSRAAFLGAFFPPRQVMLHQKDIDLRPEQADAIKRVVVDAQQRLVDIQWRLEAESAELEKLVSAPRVDETAALRQLETVAAIEQEMKDVNFALLIRIKNELDPAQQAKLRLLAPPPELGFRVFRGPVPPP